MLWYINAPGYRWNYACGVIIESLGYVWGLTGDQRYLELGWNSFKTEMAVTAPTGTTLVDSWRGLLRYMYWSDRVGFLTDL
jgi:rhamnogalacturonyl hydrolase YesR